MLRCSTIAPSCGRFPTAALIGTAMAALYFATAALGGGFGKPPFASWPVAAAATALLAYNWARFGNALDFGYLNQNVSAAMVPDLKAYGQFDLHFLVRNAYWAFVGLPAFHSQLPFFTPRPEGMGTFIVTPALLYLFRSPPRALWSLGAWAAIAFLNVPLLLYYSTGTFQFGYRFSLNYLPIAICLLAANLGTRASPAFLSLVVLSVLVNLRGTIWWFAR
jgi:hypothetical protein